MNNAQDVVHLFEEQLSSQVDMSLPVLVIKILSDIIKKSKAKTMTELIKELQNAIQVLSQSTKSSISFSAGCELFMRFVTRTAMDVTDFEACRDRLICRGEVFVEKASELRQKVANLGSQFIRDGSVILIHSYSRTLMRLLITAAEQKIRFKVYVTEARPNTSGYKTARQLQAAGIPATIIMDTAVAYFIEKVDIVIVGAEGVVESGGIINQVGTYQLAIIAKIANKPFYVAAESFKFVRLFPLNQFDLPMNASTLNNIINPSNYPDHFPIDLEIFNPLVDYTPPSYINLLFTDLGILTPSAVSDELIKLYY